MDTKLSAGAWESTPRNTGAVVRQVADGSLAAAAGIGAGDIITEINGHPVRDVIDYQYSLAEPEVILTVRKPEKTTRHILIENNYTADLGVVLAADTFDGLRCCRNRCIFCFVDQQPGGLRPSLQVRDDDYRHSFLHGNYLSLTNLRPADRERIIYWHLSPLYVSVHTTNPDLRAQMMGTRRASGIREDLRHLTENGITIHAQAVLCPGINDGPELDRTIADLAGLWPGVASLAVVPVGLTRYREGLYPLQSFTSSQAAAVLRQVHAWQENCLTRVGGRFVFAADEFYLLAGRDFPPAPAYEDFPQLENGVGMARQFIDSFRVALGQGGVSSTFGQNCLVVTGKAAGSFLPGLVEEIQAHTGLAGVQVASLSSFFWGPDVTVAGLLTGNDLRQQLPEYLAGSGTPTIVLLPASCLNEDGLFLDGISGEELARELAIDLVAVPPDGRSLVEFLRQGGSAT